MKLMKKAIPMLMAFGLLFYMVDFAPGLQAQSGVKPIKNNVKKWRIGYCEATPFSNYASTLYNLVQGFQEYGWLENVAKLPFKNGQADTRAMWEWLAKSNVGDYIEFPKDAYYSLDSMKVSKGKLPEEIVIDRLKNKKDIDIMIVMGTKAGILLSESKHNVPIFVFSSSNAYSSGITNAVEFSTSDHVWAHMDINRFKRQLQVFTEVFKFKKLGIVYENSKLGKTYSGVADIEYMAKEKGFEIVREFVNEPISSKDTARYKRELKNAYKRLATKVDGMYITIASIDASWLPELLEPFYLRKIPVFSQFGEEEVKYGALMSISFFDFPNMGRFGADTIIKKLLGTPMYKLPQEFENTPQILLNLEAAKKIGYKPDFEILLIADKIYNTISK